MLEIEKLDLHSLRNHVDFDFHYRVYNWATAQLTREEDKTAVATYGEFVEQLGEALRKSKSSLLTKDIKAAHDYMLRLYVGMSMGVRSLTYAPDADLAREAQQIVGYLKKFDSPFKGTYDSQYSTLYRIHRGLQDLPDATRSMLELDRWLGPLDEALNQFMDLRQQCILERAKMKEIDTLKVRAAVDKAYLQFATVIQAYALVYGDSYYASFIQQLNSMISEVNANMKARSTRNRNKRKKEQQQAEATHSTETSAHDEA